ncbi:hypothetical protein K474DRAFT_1661352 [Panus rudis PR-1116 ss-1]|nr:hypothetical protein K474DRAFT_1661352 [Panus rudis PR-1116 ss-1]
MIVSYRLYTKLRTHTHIPCSHSRRWNHASTSHVRDDLRTLLRETAQPVAVVTSLMPLPHAQNTKHSKFHGATLSSFSSIAMDPHPLVAFSLRIPSRMATSLKNSHDSLPSHMVVNILSAAQAELAVQFSRPDLHPHPFATVPYTLTKEGLPVLTGALGSLSCKLVASSWPLHDLDLLRAGETKEDAVWEGDGVASELFIAEVIRVEDTGEVEGHDALLRTLPLLYHRRAYSTTRSISSKQTQR